MPERISDFLRHGARDRHSAYAPLGSVMVVQALLDELSGRQLGRDGAGLRIGYLNPWSDKAENQAYMSLAAAARRLGVELVSVTTSDRIEAADLDFVIAVASTQPKTTSVPTFGSIHEPRTRFFQEEGFFQNLLSYDGYFTISDTLHRFLCNIAHGFGRYSEIGAYYNTPQLSDTHAPIQSLASSGDIQLCYFGTNWDNRNRPMFRALASKPYMRIYGPQGSWDYLGEGYVGSVPFDGKSVQSTYANFGAGLAVLAKDHLLDDIISNRIFEITSVGAVAICPDIPWIRKHYGDSVYYYPPHDSYMAMVKAVDAAMDEIRVNPEQAAERAQQARLIFEENFCAERMLANAIQMFDDWKNSAGLPSDPVAEPLIDVIVRVGGRPTSLIKRAIDSIDAQLSGRFRIVFVRYMPLDLSSLTGGTWSRIESFEIIDVPGGARAATMTAGLMAISAPYFAFLDDDDLWLANHIRDLLARARELPVDRAYVYSGYLVVNSPQRGHWQVTGEARRIAECTPVSGSIFEILGRLQTGAFLASSALLRHIDLEGWLLQTAEDSLLHGNLIARAEVSFTWRPSVCWTADSIGRSNFNERESRQEDVLECLIRLAPLLDQIEQKFAGRSMPPWARLGEAVQRVFEANDQRVFAVDSHQGGRLVLEEGLIGTPLEERDGLIKRELSLDRLYLSHEGAAPKEGEDLYAILPLSSPWAFGGVRALDRGELFGGPQWIVLEFDRLYGSFGIGVRDGAGEFLTRIEAPARDCPMEIWLHIREPDEAREIIVQNWTGISKDPALLRRIWVVEEAHDA